MERLFDPYAVRDLGETFPPTLLRAVEWLVDLHDNLLAGQTGRHASTASAASCSPTLIVTGFVALVARRSQPLRAA